MAEEVTTTSNIHPLPAGIYRSESDENGRPEDAYEQSNRELLVDMDAEEKKDPEVQSEKKLTYIAAALLAAIMMGSYFGYDWYQQYKISESVTAIAAIESAPVANQTTTPQISTVEPINEPAVQTSPTVNENAATDNENSLLNLINTASPEKTSLQEVTIESTPSPISASVETTIDPINNPVNIEGNIINSNSINELRTTMERLASVTESLKASLSEMNFQLDQNTERMTQAVYRIEALEKKSSPTNKSTSSSSKAPKKTASTTASRQQWIDSAKVVSVRKIGESFIAKINISGNIKRMSVGDKHELWVVHQIDLDSGKIHFKHQKNNQQRTLFL